MICHSVPASAFFPWPFQVRIPSLAHQEFLKHKLLWRGLVPPDDESLGDMIMMRHRFWSSYPNLCFLQIPSVAAMVKPGEIPLHVPWVKSHLAWKINKQWNSPLNPINQLDPLMKSPPGCQVTAGILYILEKTSTTRPMPVWVTPRPPSTWQRRSF